MPTPLKIGPVSRNWLREIDVTTLEDLRQIGSVAAYQRVRDLHPDRVSLNLLYGLEALLLGIDWRVLPPEIKEELKKQANDA